MTGRLALLVEVGEQVAGGPLVEPGGHHPGLRLRRSKRAELAGELTEGATEFGRPAEGVALPERQPARVSGRRRDEHPVVSDVLDAPRRRAESEDVADARLVDHLLVQLADP